MIDTVATFTLSQLVSSITKSVVEIAEDPDKFIKALTGVSKEKGQMGGLFQDIAKAGNREWTKTYGRPGRFP